MKRAVIMPHAVVLPGSNPAEVASRCRRQLDRCSDGSEAAPKATNFSNGRKNSKYWLEASRSTSNIELCR
jgi:hypothetical protein